MLNLYRRHHETCPGGHSPKIQTYESDELRPKWKKCGCPIHASGKLGDNPKFRKVTKRFTWAEARAVADAWERQGPEAPPPPVPTAPQPGQERVTIKHAAQECLKEYARDGSAKATQYRYKTLLKQFTKFCTDIRGYVYLDQWHPRDNRDFKDWWIRNSRRGITLASWRTYHGSLKSFFEFAIDPEQGWLDVNPARVRERRKNRTTREAQQPKQKSSFTDAEINRMLDAAAKYSKRQGRRSDWGGEDIEDFIQLSRHVGLRISDVATFHISRLADNGDVHFRALKNNEWIDTWIPEWLQEIVRERAQRPGHNGYVFGKPVSSDPHIIGSAWRKRLNRFWSLCGPWKERPTHHRFRHTFVRVLLQRNVPVSKVAELLGDTEEVVRKSYSKWVPERQESTRKVIQMAFQEEPRLRRVK